MLNELRVDLFEPIRTDLMNAREKLIKQDETKSRILIKLSINRVALVVVK